MGNLSLLYPALTTLTLAVSLCQLQRSQVPGPTPQTAPTSCYGSGLRLLLLLLLITLLLLPLLLLLLEVQLALRKWLEGPRSEVYTAVSVWLCEDRRSTSISGTVSSSGLGQMSAYSRDECLLLRDDCFFSTAARLGLEGLASSPCRNALTTRICGKRS